MRHLDLLPVLAALLCCAGGVRADQKERPNGERAFERHCASCHPDGKNTINQAKPLDRESLKRSGIDKWQGIVGVMRKPGPGMPRFDNRTIPDREARAIAEYVLKAFK